MVDTEILQILSRFLIQVSRDHHHRDTNILVPIQFSDIFAIELFQVEILRDQVEVTRQGTLSRKNRMGRRLNPISRPGQHFNHHCTEVLLVHNKNWLRCDIIDLLRPLIQTVPH